ncbi:leucine-rich repeat-containing protein 17 [Triplophysa rosa]|uniref:Leucine-rich repeat-containing protein 17 n=1 Tax=Triplophysa rosa TaxID=992332 RepID=A0A9W7T6Y5_TRIRA|nr:leucine-rich repeat-containing protein 17 [Triplophysa rosa]KAI7791639.1 putative leucine-rich repeat-containing protein 17 [Triplophysa rosa]
MRLLRGLLLLLFPVFWAADARKDEGRSGRWMRGRGRARAVKRFAADCKESSANGEKYLDCQERQLKAVTLGWPEDIDHLLLARNRIQVLRDNTFSNFRNLRSLDLQQNEISRIEENAFSGLSKLTTLLLQHNHLQVVIEDVLIPMPQLRYLRIHDNPWRCDCQLDSLVRFIQVPSNRHFGNYAKCAEPTAFWGSKLKKLDVDQLCIPQQEKVEIPQTEHEKLPAPIKQSDASTLCHTYMHPVPHLDCRNRELKTVPADIPLDIVRLDLSKNNIKQLRPKEFVTVKDLKLLNLSGNSLERIDTAAFAGLLYLNELDLSNNSLKNFQYGVLEDLYFLKRLSLGNNPWICDYNIHYLIYWLKHHRGVYHTGLVCGEPEEFRGWSVEDYVKTYNGECPKDLQFGQTADPAGITAQELTAETEEEELGPIPYRGPKKYEIIRLT